MIAPEQLERIRVAAREELDRMHQLFRSVNLTWSSPELTREVPSTVELKIEFYKETDLVDILECFVLRDGTLVVSETEVREWIREHVPDIIRRQQKI